MGKTGVGIMDLKEVVITITTALSVDYASQFKKAYANADEITLLKKRMWMGLKNVDPESSAKAYQLLCDETPEYMPTLQSILSRSKSIQAKTRREQADIEEHERLAQLPPPAHNVDPLKMLRDAKEATQERDSTQEERDERIARHNAVISEYTRKGYVKTAPRSDNWKCAVHHCRQAGSFSGGFSDTWFCKEHYRA